MNCIAYRFYLAGYSGWTLARPIRRLIARSQWHRAWFLGYSGYFGEGGNRYGLSNPYPGFP